MPYIRAYAADVPTDAPDDPAKPVTFVASTEGIKVDGFDLKADEWDLSRYMQHPVVLWAHDLIGRNLPIGTGTPWFDGSRLMVDVAYDTDDDFAMKVRNKARKRMIAGSVEWLRESDKNVLLEFSNVPLGLDPASLPARQVRGWRALLEEIERGVSDPEPQETSDPDVNADSGDAWSDIATEMVQLFTTKGEATDAKRRHTYNGLERRYRQLDKVAPEFLAVAQIAALGTAERRGLFLEGEPELCPTAFPAPLRLSARKLALVSQALALLQEALNDAEPLDDADPEPQAQSATPEPEETIDLDAIKEALQGLSLTVGDDNDGSDD